MIENSEIQDVAFRLKSGIMSLVESDMCEAQWGG